MPTAPVDEHDNQLFYEDSGPPPGAAHDYTTLIIVHGTAFHGVIFHRLLPLAAQHNTRVILVNRRDYPGSSPYSDDDMHNISDVANGAAYEAFFTARSAEFATLIEWLVMHEDIPKANWENKTGGVFLLAWSSGNAFVLPTPSYVDKIRQSTVAAIEPYLRGVILFDAPRWILGLPFIAAKDQSFQNESISVEERARQFSDWVGGYYSHPAFTTFNIADLQQIPAADARTSTPEAMSKEELENCTNYDAVLRSELKARAGPVEGYAERVRRAVFDERLARGYWPKCRVDVIWCEMSPWPMIELGWMFEKYKKDYAAQGVEGRQLNIAMMSKANHFPHWDEPEKTMEFFAKTMSS